MPDRFEGHPVTDELLATAAGRTADDARDEFAALIAEHSIVGRIGADYSARGMTSMDSGLVDPTDQAAAVDFYRRRLQNLGFGVIRLEEQNG
jgi:GGDEF domain-containing protein